MILMERLLRGVAIPNEKAIRHLYKTMLQLEHAYLAKSLKLHTLIEGVETKEQLAFTNRKSSRR